MSGRHLVVAAALAVALTPTAARADRPSGGWVDRLRAAEAMRAPAGDRPAQIDRNGVSVLPNGRLIDPAGPTAEVAPHPFGLVLSPDGGTAATVNSGVKPFSVSLVQTSGDRPLVRQIPPGNENDEGIIDAVFMGAAYSPDGRSLYVSGGNDGNVVVLDPLTGAKTRTIDLNVPFGGQLFVANAKGFGSGPNAGPGYYPTRGDPTSARERDEAAA